MEPRSRSEGQDVIEVLTRDHREIEAMLHRLSAGPEPRLAGLLVATLVRHAVAEEEYVYPAVRDQVPGGERIADRGLSQHAQVEETMQQIATADTKDPKFRRLLAALADEVRRHVQYDESELFPKLRRACTKTDLARLGERVARLEPAGHAAEHWWRGGLVDQLRTVLGRRGADPR